MASKDDKQRPRRREATDKPLANIDSSEQWDNAVEQWGQEFQAGEDVAAEATDKEATPRQDSGTGGLHEVDTFIKHGGEIGGEEQTEALGALLGAPAELPAEGDPSGPTASASNVPGKADSADVVEPLDRAFDLILGAEDREPAVRVDEAHPPGGEKTAAAVSSDAETQATPSASQPLKAPPATAPSGPSIFEGIEEQADEEEPAEPGLPPLPAGLDLLDLASLESIEQVEPLVADPSYWERLEAALVVEAAQASSTSAAAELEFEAALAAQRLGRPQLARERYREVLAHRPRDIAALLALWDLASAQEGGGSDLVAAIVDLFDPAARRALAPMRAERQLFADGGDLEEARALAEESGDEPRRLLTALLLPSGTDGRGERIRLFQRLVDAALPDDGPERAAAYLVLGWLHESAPTRDDEAVHDAYLQAVRLDADLRAGWEGLLRTALRVGNPGEVSAAWRAIGKRQEPWSADCLRRAWSAASAPEDLSLLKASLDDRSADPDYLRTLAAALTQSGDSRAAVELLIRVPDLLADSAEQVEALLEIAELLAWSGDPAAALEQLERVVAIQPDSEAAERVRQRLLSWAPEPAARREAHLLAASQLEGSEGAAEYLQAARASLEAADADGAKRALAVAMVSDPNSDVAVGLLRQACDIDGDVAPLAAALSRAAQAATVSERRAQLSLCAAELYDGPLAQLDDALTHYRLAASETANPELSQPARVGSRRVLRRMDRLAELADELRRDGADIDLPGQRRADLLALAGHLSATTDEQVARADYQAALEANEEHEAARWQLLRLSFARGEWDQAADQLHEIAERMQGGRSEAAIWLRAAALLEEHKGPSEAALADYTRAQRADPTVPGAAEGLSRCLRQAPDQQTLCDQLESQLAATEEPAERFALLMVLVGLLRSDPDRREAMRQRLEAAARLQPDSAFVRRCQFLDLREAEAWDAARAHLWPVESPPETEAPTVVTAQLAELAQLKGDSAEVAAIQSVAIARDNTDAYAARVLQRHRAEHGDWMAYVALRKRAVEGLSGGSDAAALWLDLGQCLRAMRGIAKDGELSPQEVEAIDWETGGRISSEVRTCLEEALYRDPRCTVALHALLDDAWAANDVPRMASLFEQLAGASDRAQDAAVCFTRAGELQDDDIYSYRCALQRAEDHLLASARLRDAALRAGNWALAYEATAAQAQHSASPERAAEAHRLAADLALDRLGDRGKALQHLRRLVRSRGDWDRSFEQICALLRAERQWGELTALLGEAAAQDGLSDERHRELHWQIANVAVDGLGDNQLAKAHLLALLERSSEDPRALALLARLYQEGEQWAEAAETLLRQARVEAHRPTLRDVLVQLGCIYQDHLADIERAKASLSKAVQIDPRHAETLRRLAQVYLETEEFEEALDALHGLGQLETDTQTQVDLQLQMGKIWEDKLHDTQRAGRAFRAAMEVAADDLKAIGALCGFYARQGDQRSVMIHLDTALSTMRRRFRADPYEAFAVHAMFKIFGWRRHPDGCLCAAQVLDALGQAGAEEVAFVESHARAARPGKELWGAADEHDELVFKSAVPGGFRQIFRLLAEPLGRLHRADLQRYGVSTADRVDNDHHPVRSIGDALAGWMGVKAYDLYILEQQPTSLIVENTDPPSILLGANLVRDATEEQIQFLMGRSLWLMHKAMILPARLRVRDLSLLISAVVRNYLPGHLPVGVTEQDLQSIERQVAKAIPRRLRQELMPFALECSGANFDPQVVGAAVLHSANRAGLLACRSVQAACRALHKASGPDAEGNPEAEELRYYAVSDAHLQLRKALGIAID